MAERHTKKKVVKVETPVAADGTPVASEPEWTPTPEASARARQLRVIAAILWVLAIAGEVVAIFVLLRQTNVNMVLLIIAIVAIGILAVAGSFAWKKSNDLAPASRSNPTRFFVQNQLGAIITVIAFLPLIIMILLNKNMSGGQKAVAASVGVVVLGIAAVLGANFNPPSTEQYSAETNQVVQITGKDEVFWTKSGTVFHLCADASAVNLESKDGTIYSGTVAQAHEAGKSRLTKEVELEMRQCGYAPTAELTPTP